MPGFNINNFRGHINKHGALNNSKFFVNIVTPPGLVNGYVYNNGSSTQNYSREVSDLISFRADSVRTPGVAFAASNIFRYGIGPSEKKPFNATFSDIGISFIADKNAKLYAFFYNWMNYIFNFAPGHGNGSANFNSQNSGMASYSLTYKNYYSTDIEIVLYDESGEKPVQIFRLLKAFPISLNEINLSWSDKSSLMRLNVNFTFKEFKLDNVSQQNFTAIANAQPTTVSANGAIRPFTSNNITTSRTNIYGSRRSDI